MVIRPEDVGKPMERETDEVSRISKIIDTVLMQGDPVENDRLGIEKELYIIALNEKIPIEVREAIIAIYEALGWNVYYVLLLKESGGRFELTTPKGLKRLTKGEKFLIGNLETLIDGLLATKDITKWFYLETELEGKLSEKVIGETVKRYQEKQPKAKLSFNIVWKQK